MQSITLQADASPDVKPHDATISRRFFKASGTIQAAGQILLLRDIEDLICLQVYRVG